MDEPRFVPIACTSSRSIIDTPWCSMQADQITHPDGSRGVHYLLHIPRAAVILPVLDDGRIVLIRQWRYALRTDHLELPAGRIDEDEPPLEAAARELREETGYRARTLTPLPPFHPLMGLSDHEALPFLARGLSAGDQQLEAPEQIAVEIHTPAEVLQLIRTGAITDVFALVPLMHYLLFG